MSMLLNKKSEKIILEQLGIKSLNEVNDMDYPDKEREFERDDIEEELCHLRGSVRITNGNYLTEKEYKEHRKQVRSIKL